MSPGDIACGVPARLERQRIVSLDGGTLETVLEGFARVADVLGVAEAGRALVRRLRARAEAVASRVRALPAPTVACIEWTGSGGLPWATGARARRARGGAAQRPRPGGGALDDDGVGRPSSPRTPTR